MEGPDLADAAEALRRVLAAVEAGELAATAEHEARLRAALDALDGLTAPPAAPGTTDA